MLESTNCWGSPFSKEKPVDSDGSKFIQGSKPGSYYAELVIQHASLDHSYSLNSSGYCIFILQKEPKQQWGPLKIWSVY